MVTKTKQWATGIGNATIEYTGQGDGQIIITSDPNSLYEARSMQITVKTTDGSGISRTVTIQQAAKQRIDLSAAAAQKTGQTLTLAGTSNSKKLTFSKGTDNIGLTIPDTYLANTVVTNNGAEIAGDPGQTAEYPFSIQFVVPANETVEPKTCQIVVTDDGGTSHTCLITLAAGDAYLTVGQPSGELPWDGSTSVTISVESNTSWTIE